MLRRRLLLRRLSLLLLLLLLQCPSVRTSLLLLLPQNFIVDLITIVLYSQLCVVINWDANHAVAIKLIFGVMELDDVRVPQSVLGGDAPGRVELEAQTQEVQCLARSPREHLS